ncbi:MAG: DUF523 domain-containing protein [Acidimicrobiales bacterium]|nr:DUF523 domain-containing protein [Acidimicrobiales bacterium]
MLVSACLLGVRCNHRGEANPSDPVAGLASRYRLVPVCPETAGGLATPRDPAELAADGRVRTLDGTDVTGAYERGAGHAVALGRAVGARAAVLKARSPSCGCHEVYDGTFSRRLVPGLGVTARALVDAGVAVCAEDDVAAGLDPGGGAPAPRAQDEGPADC